MLQILVALLGFASPSRAAIFGVDDRIAVTPTSAGAEVAASTAVAVLSSNFETTSPGRLKINVESLEGYLCPKEKFSKAPSLPYACTGFLVAPDLIVTAGHCMVNAGESRNETESYCQAFSWLFDYRTEKDGSVQTTDISADKLYRCKQVVYAVRDEQAPYRDFALVQLERPVTDRKPLSLSAGPVAAAESLGMVGYPLGIPATYSQDAKILLNDPSRESFITTLDAFEGNSGSPVFNSKNEVVGILIGGTPIESLIDAPGLSCKIVNRCDENGANCLQKDQASSIPGFQGTGSEVQRIAPLKTLIENFNRNR